jgi:hypothetical protein
MLDFFWSFRMKSGWIMIICQHENSYYQTAPCGDDPIQVQWGHWSRITIIKQRRGESGEPILETIRIHMYCNQSEFCFTLLDYMNVIYVSNCNNMSIKSSPRIWITCRKIHIHWGTNPATSRRSRPSSSDSSASWHGNFCCDWILVPIRLEVVCNYVINKANHLTSWNFNTVYIAGKIKVEEA